MEQQNSSSRYLLETGDHVIIAETARIVADSGAVIKLGPRTEIRDYAVLESVAGGDIEIGSDSVVGYGSWIHGTGGVSIGNNVLIGPSVAITSTTHRHDLTIPIANQGLRMARSTIEDGVWIGANVTITAGSHIGKGAIIGAGSTVKGAIPEGTIAAGNPARTVANRKYRKVLFYLQPMVLRGDPLLFSCIVDRYEPLARSFAELGWVGHFCGSDELAETRGNNGFEWHCPGQVGLSYPKDQWLTAWRSILIGEELPIHADYINQMLGEVKPDLIFCWNFDAELKANCDRRGIIVVFNELGLTREPNPLVYYADVEGVNATASMRRQWVAYEGSTEMRADLQTGNTLRREKLLLNYELTEERRLDIVGAYGKSDGFVLVLLQVSDDSNILAGSPFGSMQAFVEECLAAVDSSTTVVVKPHPAEPHALQDVNERLFLIASPDHTTPELIAAADAVFTINSSAGFEAALAGKAVYVLGNAPYGHLGITHDVKRPHDFRELWLRWGKAPAADSGRLDAVACFAFLRYFMGGETFLDARCHLARVAHHIVRDGDRSAARAVFADSVEIELLLGRVADLKKTNDEYEKWVQILSTGKANAELALVAAQKSVDEVSQWAHQLQAERASVLVKRNGSQLVEAGSKHLMETQPNIQRILGWNSSRPAQSLRGVLLGISHRMSKDYFLKLERSLKTRVARLPLPAPVRDQLRALYHAVRRAVRPARTIAPSLLAPVAIRPEAQATGLPDYIFWGVIDWHFRHQRPQHLAQAIAATGRRVFYISAHLEDQNAPGFSIEQLDHSGRLFQIRLYVRGAPPIYDRSPDATALAQLKQGIGEMLDWANGRHIISIVQHSYWHAVATLIPNSRMVYDCMDHHEGFGNNSPDILSLEKQLLRDADLTIATSSWLAELITPRTTHCQIVRNAGDYQHFSTAPTTVFRDPEDRKVIGYIGAIAEWFDLELIEKIARRFGNCLVLLVGNDTAGASTRLRHLKNVQLTGEIAYTQLPFYVHSFDVCLLPFRIIPLTLATNPVKVYEYLGTGKPVVATSLPETLQFGDLIEKATSHEEFLHAVERSLSADPTQGREARQRFAREQTWAHRGREIIAFTESPRDEPLVSVVVVTYNNLALTQTCLASLDTYSDYPAIEIIVVDNASGDGSPDFLRTWAQEGAKRTLVLNAENRGFAAANNQGLSIAKGEYVILLNNDTHVTPGWIRTLVAHMRRDPTIGLIGPVTNNIGNEAKIEIGYTDMPQMLERSAAFTRRHLGVTFDLPTVAFFCVAIPRTVYEKIGPLDEAFGRGFFEDDDYCRRVEQIGLRIVCAADVFIHHHLSASFNKLGSTERQKLFNQNKAYYESKWGEWKPHSYR